MKDLYILERSTEINIITQDDFTASLDLVEADNLPFQLSGTVTNSVGGAAIENAFVAVYSTGVFVAGDYTDENGEYSVSLDAGTGFVAIASATGFAPSASYTFDITDESVTHAFELTAFTEEDRVIYGKVLESGTGTAIEGARIDVIDSLGTVVASTISILDGEYSVPNLELGTYSLVVSIAGYNTQRESVVIEAGSTLVEVEVTLTAHTEPAGSTISGYITREDDGEAIPNAWVGLYRLPDEVLLETTTTNADGYYCFEDVPNGNYVVKSKAVEQ